MCERYPSEVEGVPSRFERENREVIRVIDNDVMSSGNGTCKIQRGTKVVASSLYII
ncbi:hypothetical protein WN48_07376 [Eufriesea mexicana]|uniref:Uncharacterized protein n=1 Tax=Eufriesea mexicana TaxID=516756 RepID=A0A310SI91_9HYME|nr:hypothetical protein WN48_07376 [Eufriesea mexicana]